MMDDKKNQSLFFYNKIKKNAALFEIKEYVLILYIIKFNNIYVNVVFLKFHYQIL